MPTSLDTPPRSNVLGVGISELNPASAVNLFMRAVHESYFTGYVTVTGVHGVVESQDDIELKRIHNRSFVSTPDGVPMVWMSKLQGHRGIEQTCGPDFLPIVCRRSIKGGERHFFWGGGDGVVDILKSKLEERHSGIQIVGIVTPPFRPLTEEEEENLVNQIIESRPHFFWVGLSTPKQERFMSAFLAKYGDRIRRKDQGMIMFGVGAAFDFQAGIVKECPRWIRGSGFEWFYRMCKDPKRLAKRYMKSNPRFLWNAFLQYSGLKKYELPK